MYKLESHKPRNPLLSLYEIRIYKNWADLKRARTQIRRNKIYCVDFLEVHGPALQIIKEV